MQADLFKCPSCSKQFDLELRIPKVLISCHHCLCLKCLQKIFITHSSQAMQCPTCNISFLSTFTTPEDFPTNPTILQLLQSRPKRSPRDNKEADHKKAFNSKEDEDLFQGRLMKKLKTEQEIDDELGKLQESIISRFNKMRKKPSPSQNIEPPVNVASQALSNADSQKKTISEHIVEEFKFMLKEEYIDDHQNENPLTEIVNKLEGVITEAQEALNSYVKTRKSLKATLTPLKTNAFNLFQDYTYEAHEIFTPSRASDELEAVSQSDKKTQQREKEMQELKDQFMDIKTELKLKLDLSNRDISDETFTTLCSKEFWNGIDQNKILSLNVNFSKTAISDKKFTTFIQDIMSQMENLNSITINIAETEISNECIRVLSRQCLKRYKLKSFGLNCSQISIGYEGIRSLDDGLSWSVQTLKNLEIILGSTDLRGEKFLDSLMGMSQLKHLKLSFENSNISSEVVSSVVFCLHFLAKNLESLDLNFNGTEIDDEDLESFASHGVSQMERLKNFRLCLGKTLISDEFLFNFFQSLSSLTTHLETLELDLHSLELDNTSFKYFCKDILSQMQNIEHLKLGMSAVKKADISPKNAILPVHRLESLALNFNENKTHDSGLQNFKENNDLENTKSNDLHQAGRTETSDETLQDFINHLEKGCQTQALSSPSEQSLEAEKCSNKEVKRQKKNKESVPKKFDVEKKVYAELKKELILHYGRKQDPAKMSTHRAGRLIKDLEPGAYDNILIKILTRVLFVSTVQDTELEEWKERIEARISSHLEMISQKPKKKQSRKKIQRNQNNNNIGTKQKDSMIVKSKSCSNSRSKENTCNTRRKENKTNREHNQSNNDDNLFSEV